MKELWEQRRRAGGRGRGEVGDEKKRDPGNEVRVTLSNKQ